MESKAKALVNKIGNRHTYAQTKGQALALFKAQKNKKKLPTFKHKHYEKDPDYKKLSIEEYEKKYPTFKD